MKDELLKPVASVDFNIPEDQRKGLEQRRRQRNIDLATQIAFMEYGVSRYLTDADLCEAYCITPETLVEFKKNHREQIERYKDEHRFSKFKIFTTIGETLTLRSAMVKAGIEGKPEVAQQIADVLTQAEKVLPMRTIKEMAEIMKEVEGESQAQDPKASININVNSNMREAQEAFERRRKEKIIDIKNEEKK